MQINALQKEINELIKAGKKVINLSAANSTFFESLLLTRKIQKAFPKVLSRPYYEANTKGYLTARQSIADFYQKIDITIDPENILLTSGTSESYLYLFRYFSQDGGEILFPRPSYPLFSEIAKLVNIELKYYNLNAQNSWKIDVEDLETKITPKTRAIVLISPNNPTGSMLSKANLQDVLALAKKHNIAIISDEVFSEFVYNNEEFPSPLYEADNQLIFSLNGLSKTYALPGLKLSWILMKGPQKELQPIADQLELMIDALLSCNQFSQVLLPTILKEGGKWLKNYHARIEKNRLLTIDILSQCPNLEFHYPEGGFYIFPKVLNTKLTDEEFCLDLLKKTGLYVHPGYFYDFPENCHFLLCFLQDPKILKKSLKKIVKYLSS